VIRAATPADLQALAAVESAVYHPVIYPGFFFRQSIDLWPGLLQVAEMEGAVVGYVLCAPALTPGEAWILSAGVDPRHRGRGIGRSLVEAALASLSTYDRVRLTVSPDNQVAIRLYERLGFSGAEVHPDHFGAGQPRLLMERRRRLDAEPRAGGS
jgi:[ribosomal protein S18]-alanine N-acetyltransferase